MPATSTDRGDTVRDLYLAHRSTLLAVHPAGRAIGTAAKDALQETMIRAYLHADRLWPDETARRAWLFRVGHNIAVDNATACSRSVPVGIRDELSAATPVDEGPDLTTRIDVARVVRRLSKTQRRVIFEVFYRGNSVTSAAEVIGISPSTASTHLSTSLRRLRAQLASPLEKSGSVDTPRAARRTARTARSDKTQYR